jgi:hypothetical protein
MSPYLRKPRKRTPPRPSPAVPARQHTFFHRPDSSTSIPKRPSSVDCRGQAGPARSTKSPSTSNPNHPATSRHRNGGQIDPSLSMPSSVGVTRPLHRQKHSRLLASCDDSWRLQAACPARNAERVPRRNSRCSCLCTPRLTAS